MTNKELFKQAVNEGFVIRMERDAAVIEKDIICSEGHYRKLSEIFGFEVKKPKIKRTTLRRAVAAILIAAALLLAGCAAVVYREQIGNFFVNTYETYIKGYFVNNNEEKVESIEEYYTLTYVPEGYEVFENNESSVLVQYKWKNAHDDMIAFEQIILDTTRFTLDAENGDTSVLEYANLTLYCRTIDNYKYYIWCDYNYSYSLQVCIDLKDSELFLILDGISPKMN